MKILHAHMAMTGGGIEAMISALSNEMSKSIMVEVLTIFEPGESDIFLKRLISGIKIHTLGKKKPGISFKYIWKMYRFIKNSDYDIVNIHGFFYYHFLSIILNHRKTKYFYTVHSDAEKENNNWDRKFFWLKKFCFRHNWMRPITISEASKKSFDKLYECNSTLIPNGVPRPIVSQFKIPLILNDFRVTNKTKLFLHAGRISAAKNQLRMCEAFSQIVSEGFDVSLIIAGAKQDESIFNSLEPFFDKKRIHYIGERNDITCLLYYCDAMLLPSIWEGLPVILLESLSVGCIPICSPVGGIVNVIKNGYNGILSADSSKEAIVAALKNYLALNENELMRLKSNAKQSFGKFDISHTSNEYLKAYREK